MPTKSKANESTAESSAERVETPLNPIREQVPAPAVQASSAEKKQAPTHSEQGLAIWTQEKNNDNRPDYYVKLTRTFGSPFFAGASEKSPVVFNAYAGQKFGPTLEAQELAAVIKGELFEATFQSNKPNAKKPEYTAFLSPAGIESSAWKTDPTKENHTLRIGRAFPLFKTDDDEQRVQWGWELDRVVFPLTVKHGNAFLNFTPAHGFQCLNAGECRINGHSVKFLGSEQKHADQTPVAKLQITALKRELAEKPKVASPQHSLSP